MMVEVEVDWTVKSQAKGDELIVTLPLVPGSQSDRLMSQIDACEIPVSMVQLQVPAGDKLCQPGGRYIGVEYLGVQRTANAHSYRVRVSRIDQDGHYIPQEGNA